MPFKYIIKWRRTNPEKVSVEAYHRFPHSEEDKHKPAFTIGQAEGGGILAIRHLLERAADQYPHKKRGNITYVLLNENDEVAYEAAYRIGLATAMIDKAQTPQQIQKGTQYVQNATSEEVWFWTSKLLDDETGPKALEALSVLSGSALVAPITTLGNIPSPPTPHPITPTKPPQKTTEARPTLTSDFWPTVRRRMTEKALQLYAADHPDAKQPPKPKELRENGYLQTAKVLALREIRQEKKQVQQEPTNSDHSKSSFSASKQQNG